MGHPRNDAPAVQPDLTVEHHQRRTTRFLWAVLAGATLISVAGNAVHAWYRTVDLPPIVAAAVATVPPLALLCLCEAMSLMSRTRTANTATQRSALVVTGLLAMGAFVLSFDALRDLALRAGVRESLAWLWPIMVDATIGQATLSLLSLSRTPATAPEPAPAAAPAGEAHGLSTAPTAATEVSALDVPIQAAVIEPAAEKVPSRTTVGSSRPVMRAAAEAVIDAGITTLPVEVVTEVFERHSEGLNPNQIAKAVSKSRSTVSRLIERSTTTLVDFNHSPAAATAP